MKSFFVFITALAIALAGVSPVFAYTGKDIEINFQTGEKELRVNGANVNIEPPFISRGKAYAPLREIAEALGAQVKWYDDTGKIKLIYTGGEFILRIGDDTAYINGIREKLPLTVILHNARALVPIRFIAETLGADVFFDDGNITVVKKSNRENRAFSTQDVKVEKDVKDIKSLTQQILCKAFGVYISTVHTLCLYQSRLYCSRCPTQPKNRKFAQRPAT
jgi:hypothetical protein